MIFRRRADLVTDVDPGLLQTEPVAFEFVLERLIASCTPVGRAPVGERDRKEQTVLHQLRRVHAALGEPFDAEKWLNDWRRGRDYQVDHPMGSVDRILDEAFVPDHTYGRDSLVALSGLLDPLAISRLWTHKGWPEPVGG